MLATAMLAGLLAKATLVTLPVLFVLLDTWPLGRIIFPGMDRPIRCDDSVSPYPSLSMRTLLAEKMPLLVMSLILSVITLRTQAEAVQTEIPFWQARLPNAVYATAMYGIQTLYPVSLQPVYLHPGVSTRPFGLLAGCAAANIACVWLAVGCARRAPAVPVGLAWFVVSLLPVLGVVAQQGVQSHADRFTYIPHIGLSMAIVWGVAELARRLHSPPWAIPTALTAVIVTFVALDQQQLSHWRNPIALWSHTIAIDPGNPLAHCKLANSLKDLGRFDEAETRYRTALEVDPGWIPARNNLAALLVARGKLAEARQHLQQSSDSKQINPELLLELGFLFLANDRVAEAADAAEEAITLAPANAKVYFLHGSALAKLGLLEQAREAYERALQIDPEDIRIRNDLATVLTRQKRFDEAIPLYRSIIDRDPAAEVPRRNLERALEEQARNAQQKSQSTP